MISSNQVTACTLVTIGSGISRTVPPPPPREILFRLGVGTHLWAGGSALSRGYPTRTQLLRGLAERKGRCRL